MKLPELPPIPPPDIKPFMGCERGAYSHGRVRHLLRTYATTYAEAAVKAERAAILEALWELRGDGCMETIGLGRAEEAIRARSEE